MNNAVCQSCERMAKAEEAIENLEGRSKSMEKKLDTFQLWFIGILASSLLTLATTLIKR